MSWNNLKAVGEYTSPMATDFESAQCNKCRNISVWKTKIRNKSRVGELVYPDIGIAPPAAEDMPQDVKSDYEEAALIFNKSPRGAAALLRLGLQKLCKHLGEEGKNINTDIRALAEKQVLPSLIIKVADTVRITGNNAVHPGEMNEEDFDFVAGKLFELLNIIVSKGITEPKVLKELYEKTPEAPRVAAELRDATNITNSSNT